MDYINEYVTTEEVSITSSGTAEQKLYAGFGKKKPNNNNPNIELKRLFICNTDSTDITVNLWLDDEINEYYLLKGLTIKQGTTLDFNDGIPFDLDTVNNLKLN